MALRGACLGVLASRPLPPCVAHRLQSNCNWKVAMPFTMMRLSGAFSNTHSSNSATLKESFASLSVEVDAGGEGKGLVVGSILRRLRGH